MKLSKMSKEELELLSNKDITFYLLEEEGKMNTSDLFRKIITLLELPNNTFEEKIGDYYTSLTTDKRFIALEDGCWDLRSRHTSDKIAKLTEEEDEEEEIEDNKEEGIIVDDMVEDDYGSGDEDDDDYDDSTEEDLKDLVIVDDDELEE